MLVFEIAHLLYEVTRDLPICAQGLRGYLYSNASQQAVQIRTAVVPKCRLHHSCPLGVVYCHAHYRNCIPTVRGATAKCRLPLVWCTVMHISGIVHLLYEAPRDLPFCVQKLCGHPYGNVSQQAEQIRIAVLPKCRLCQSCDLGWCTAMCIFGIVHQLVEVSRHCPVCAHA